MASSIEPACPAPATVSARLQPVNRLATQRKDIVGIQAGLVDQFGAPEPGHAHHQRMVVTRRTLAHQRMRHGQAHLVDEFPQLLAGLSKTNPATDIGDGVFGAGQGSYNQADRVVVNGRFDERTRIASDPVETVRRDHLAEDVRRPATDLIVEIRVGIVPLGAAGANKCRDPGRASDGALIQ